MNFIRCRRDAPFGGGAGYGGSLITSITTTRKVPVLTEIRQLVRRIGIASRNIHLDNPPMAVPPIETERLLLRERRRWLAVGMMLAAIAIAGIVIVARRSSKGGPPIFAVLAHPTIRAGSLDAVFIVNKSGDQVEWAGQCGATVIPRTSSSFELPPEAASCLVDHPVPAHSRRLVEKTISTRTPPGKYWVWFWYDRLHHRNALHPVHAELTVIAR
jgi:hypothetical protein